MKLDRALALRHVRPTTVEGPPVVLLHGLASRGDSDWPHERWAQVLAEHGREVLVVDLPAHGDSPSPQDANQGAPSHVAARIVEAVRAATDAEVDVVAYSLGARLAWEIAGQNLLAVRRLVLGGLSPAEPFVDVDIAAAREYVLHGRTPEDGLTAMVAGMLTNAAGDSESLLYLVEGLAREPFDPAVGVPKVPTLVVAGTDDVMTTGIEDAVTHLPDVRCLRVPGDHSGALTGEDFRAAVFEFLGVTETAQL